MKNIKKYLLAALSFTAVLGMTATTSKGCMNVSAAELSSRVDAKYASVDSYYSTVDTSSGQKLLNSLHDIIKNPSVVGYSNLWTVYNDSDIRVNSQGKTVYWDMYSNVEHEINKYSGGNASEGAGMNKEHSVPQSWFNEASPMKSDAFHVYPTDCYVNNMRSSYPYGEVSSPKKTSGNGSKLGSSSFAGYSGTVFEPIDEYKGDFARTYFYMATCYCDKVGGWTKGESQKVFNGSFPYLSTYSINLFTKWDAQDPVSQKEIDRNNAVYKHQKNRNPFIDHPEYVSMIWPTEYNQNVTVDQAKVDAVIAKISALPAAASLTLDDKATVDAANTAYIALNFKEKQAVTNYSTLQAALKKIAELSGGDTPAPTETITVTGALNIAKGLAVGKQTDKEYTVVGKISGNIEAYNSQYGNATFDITDGTSTITVFRAKEGASKASFTAESFAEKITVGNVATVVGNIKNYKQGDGSLYEINPCYVLSSTKGDVPAPVIDQEKIDAVIAKINALPEVAALTLDDKAAVEAAEKAFDQLTSAEQAKVTNASKLTDAVAKIEQLGGGDKPNPNPNPKPTDDFEVEFKGISTPYAKDYTFSIGEYSFTANVGFADPQYGDFFRVGYNQKNATAIPTKFGISGNGGSIETNFDLSYVTELEFFVGGQQLGANVSKWTVLHSVDGSKWVKLAESDNDGDMKSIKVTFDEALSGKFALVIQAADKKQPRLDLTGIKATVGSKDPKVKLSDVTTNKYLNVEYDLVDGVIKNATTDSVVLAHVNKNYNVESASYGVIYTEKENLTKLIRLSYTQGDASALAALVGGSYVQAEVVEGDDEIVVKALLEDLTFDTTYTAVVVCEQNGKLVFANQTEVNEKSILKYYLANNLITDTEQLSVINVLLG